MKSLRDRRGGFTLIELMIVVAIIGILAAIAIPNFLRFQLRAKSSEGKTNLAAIRTAQEGFFSEFGLYIAADQHPVDLPGSQKAVWDNTDQEHGFNVVGWAPEGDVYFQYEVEATDAGDDPPAFTAAAVADIDGDGGDLQVWGYRKSVTGDGSDVIDGTDCEGVLDGAGNEIYNTVGPCDLVSGRSVF